MSYYDGRSDKPMERDGDVIEIIPEEQYDWHKAKLRASLSWLLSKVYSSNVPKELQDPFYETSEGQLALRPVLVNLLASSELYCQACSNMFPDTHTQWQGHWSIIQVLSRKGIYISDVQDSAVTETVLVQTAPFRLKAHLALIDALMRAYTCEVASVEKVVKAVRRFTTFPASSELPDSPEDALVFWINKICTVLRTEGFSRRGLEEVIEGEAGQKVRVLRKSVCSHQPVQVPLLGDLMRDVGNGCSAAAVIAYYKPHLLNIKDLCLKEGIGVADSLHNLRQISRFCQSHLPWKSFHLSYEDLLYSHELMAANILAFLADLFFCFEGPGSSQIVDVDLSATKSTKEKAESPLLGRKGSQNVVINVPISQVTKRSFQRQSFEDTASNLGMGGRSVSSATNVHQPLLPRRGRRSIPQDEGVLSGSPPIVRRLGRRTLSLCSPQDRETVHKSVLAWQDDQTVSQRSDEREYGSRSRGGMLANVSIDSELNQNLNASKSLSLDLSDLDAQLAVINSCHPDYLEVESVTSGQSNRTLSSQRHTDHRSGRTQYTTIYSDHKLEPLMPAMLKPTKERETNLSKAEERGDRIPRRRRGPSPSHQSSESGDLDVSVSASSDETSVSSLASALSAINSFAAEDISTAQPPRSVAVPVCARNGDFSSEGTSADDRSSEKSMVTSAESIDQESRKIHQDYKVQELDMMTSHGSTSADSSSSKMSAITPENTNEEGLSKSPTSTTCFAELKRLKDKLVNCLDKGSSHGGATDKVSSVDLKSTFVVKQLGQGDAGKTSSISDPLPPSDGPETETNGIDLGLSELQHLRLKLEQKRKEIERKKHRQEVQQNKMRQRLGKAAFMRVVSRHLDGGDDDELCDLPETRPPEYFSNSTQAQLQARLGHQPQKVLAGNPFRGQPQIQPYLQVAIGSGGQTSVTDWRAQSHKVGAGDMSDIITAAQRPNDLDQAQHQFLLTHTGHSGGAGSDSSSLSSQKPFSRAGIQQKIDNVRNKWFGNDNVLTADQGRGKEVGGSGSDLHWAPDHDLVPGTSTRLIQEHTHPPVQSVAHVASHSATQPIPVPTRAATSSPCSVSDEDFGSPLDKLNSSLTELQGEIMRLSLQHEQLMSIKSPVGIPGVGEATSSQSPASFPIHGTSQLTKQMQGTHPHHQQTFVPYHNISTSSDDSHNTSQFDLPHPSLSNSAHTSLCASAPDQQGHHTYHFEPVETSSTSKDGYFVVFGDKPTPKRSKPKPSEHHTSVVPPSAEKFAGQVSNISRTSDIANDMTPEISDDVAAILAKQTVLVTSAALTNDHLPFDSSPKVGFVIKDEAAIIKENDIEDEMQKKRVKLIEMQRKRKEEQERKRTEKEAETARKLEEKQLKEDEQERKKAEEKARREVIFQQYLQKKQEEEEVPAKPRPKKRDGSASKQRPKSMFVKSKAMTPEPGSIGPDSGNSSREDLTDRGHGPGRCTPNVMSVSCNTLQGASNAQGPPSQRRPTSPDLYRLKQRQRGSSQDSGSETGSGSNPGSDYAGPKLFVKPSSRSNRHIIANAISHCCLAGSVNTDLKNKVLEELAKCEANHFLILFRDAGCQYRGLFVFYPETEEAFKVHGVGPKHIINELCEKFYKYNSGGKSFSEITSTKHLSVSVDAVVLHTSVWKSAKAAVKR